MPIAIKAIKHHEDTEEKGSYHHMNGPLHNGMRFLSMINKDVQSCGVKKNGDDEFR